VPPYLKLNTAPIAAQHESFRGRSREIAPVDPDSSPNYDSTKVCFAYFGFVSGESLDKKKASVLRCSSFGLRHTSHARTGTLAVRSSLPQLTQAPLMARRIAFQMQ
jgi:hypothetical protein